MQTDDFGMLKAFLSSRHLTFILSTVPTSPYSRHWLLSDSAAKVFQESEIKLVAKGSGNKVSFLLL